MPTPGFAALAAAGERQRGRGGTAARLRASGDASIAALAVLAMARNTPMRITAFITLASAGLVKVDSVDHVPGPAVGSASSSQKQGACCFDGCALDMAGSAIFPTWDDAERHQRVAHRNSFTLAAAQIYLTNLRKVGFAARCRRCGSWKFSSKRQKIANSSAETCFKRHIPQLECPIADCRYMASTKGVMDKHVAAHDRASARTAEGTH